jgi:hypothetical protein
MARSRQWQTQVVEVDNPTSTTTSLNFSTSILWTFLEQFEALVNRLVFWWPRTACSISTCLTKAFSITSSLQSGLRYIRPSSWETGLQNASWPVHTMSSCLLLMTSVLPCNVRGPRHVRPSSPGTGFQNASWPGHTMNPCLQWWIQFSVILFQKLCSLWPH